MLVKQNFKLAVFLSILLNCHMVLGQGATNQNSTNFRQKHFEHSVSIQEDNSGILISDLHFINTRTNFRPVKDIFFKKHSENVYKCSEIIIESVYNENPIYSSATLRKISDLLYEVEFLHKKFYEEHNISLLKETPNYSENENVSLRIQETTNFNLPVNQKTTLYLDSMLVCGNKFTYPKFKHNAVESKQCYLNLHSGMGHNYTNYIADRDKYYTYKITNNSQNFLKIQFELSGVEYRPLRVNDMLNQAYNHLQHEFSVSLNDAATLFKRYYCGSFSYNYFVLLKPNESFVGGLHIDNTTAISLKLTNNTIINPIIFKEANNLPEIMINPERFKKFSESGLDNVIYKYSKFYLEQYEKIKKISDINELVDIKVLTTENSYDPDFENTIKIEVVNKSKFSIDCKLFIDNRSAINVNPITIYRENKNIFEIAKVSKIPFSELKNKILIETKLNDWSIHNY